MDLFFNPNQLSFQNEQPDSRKGEGVGWGETWPAPFLDQDKKLHHIILTLPLAI